MRFQRAQGTLALAVGSLAAAACGGRPDLRTDLRPEGPPEVLAVMVLTDQFSAGGGVPDEEATFCKIDGGSPDPKSPGIIGQPDFSVTQICPETAAEVTNGFAHFMGGEVATVAMVDNANPPALGGFHFRIVFDELLDVNVETLLDSETGGPCDPVTSRTCDGHINTTLPVDVQCGNASVPYDGYYVPNGNQVSWAPGPSLVVIPEVGSYATSGECSVTLKDIIVDKEGNAVPADQRGPYTTAVSPLVVLETDPGDGDEIAEDAPVAFVFTADLDGTTVSAADVSVEDASGAIAVVVSTAGNALVIEPATTWPLGTCDSATPPAACAQECDDANPCPGAYECVEDPASTLGGVCDDSITITATILDTADFTDTRGGPYVGGEVSVSFSAVLP
jgi:hypothetical protein